MNMQGFEKDSNEEIVIADNGTGVELEDTSVGEQIIKPFTPYLIRVDTQTMIIDRLRLRIESNELDLTPPDFQRKGGIWTDEAQSRLIESILIRIPLPAFYIDATNNKKWLVIDGLQRLTTIKRFMVDKTLKLRGLEFHQEFEGQRFNELPRNYQRRIAETEVTVHFIEVGTPDEITFSIFKRINTGGLPFSPQENRHILNQGEATKTLVRLANSAEFKQAVDNSIRDDRMADRECVLRYIAFTITPYPQYDEDFNDFLNKAMKTVNKMSEHEREELEQCFIRAMTIASKLFGNDAFRKRYKEDAPRQPISKPLFESWSVNFNQLSDEQIGILTARRDILRHRFIDLMNSPEGQFNEAISLATGDPKKVRLRFEAIELLIKEVLS